MFARVIGSRCAAQRRARSGLRLPSLEYQPPHQSGSGSGSHGTRVPPSDHTRRDGTLSSPLGTSALHQNSLQFSLKSHFPSLLAADFTISWPGFLWRAERCFLELFPEKAFYSVLREKGSVKGFGGWGVGENGLS